MREFAGKSAKNDKKVCAGDWGEGWREGLRFGLGRRVAGRVWRVGWRIMGHCITLRYYLSRVT